MKLFVVAGEPSGDRLGAALMAGLNQLQDGVEFHGVGGPLMQSEGLQSLFPMEELSVMGLAEIVPKYRGLMRRIAETAHQVTAVNPAALITIDSPDFCLRVAKCARAARPGLCTIHYVAPSVWAWRPGRAAKMARVIDHVLALLPFEPPYMTAAGMGATFVGHPAVAEPQASPAEAAAFRAAHDIPANAPLILALPGSRRGEVTRLAPIFGETLRLAAATHPDLRVVTPTVHDVAPLAHAYATQWPGRPVVVETPEDKRAAFAAADAALAASGTVSLELAAAGVPMVIAYTFNWLTKVILQRMVKVETVTLVNLVSETRAVPEFLGDDCRADLIAPALLDVLAGGAARKAQAEAMAVTIERLGKGGEAPGVRAARAVLAEISSRSETR